MWSNTLDSDVVKDIVELGTWLIKVIDKVGLLNSALITLATISMVKNKQGPIAFLQGISDMITGAASKVKGYTTSAMSMVAANTAVAQSTELTTVSSLKNAMATAKVDVANKNAILSSLGLANADNAQSISRDTLTASTISTMVAENQLTQAQANTIMSLLGISAASNEVNAARMNDLLMTTSLTSAQRGQIITQLGLSGSLKQLSADEVMNALASAGMAKADAEAIMAKLGLTAANKGLAASFMTLWAAVWPILALMAGAAVIWGAVKLIDHLVVTTEELAEELNDLKSELRDLESEIDTLNSELKTTEDRMAELLALPSLSFIEQEELAELKQTTAELERQLKLKEMLAGSKKDAITATSEKYIDKAWNSKSLDKSYYIDSDGVIHEDTGWNGFWNNGTDTKQALDSAMKKYENLQKRKDSLEKDLIQMSKTGESKVYTDGSGTFGINVANSPEDIQKKITEVEDQMRDVSIGVNMVFDDENFKDLKYGMSDEIDAFLDDVYAYQLKWRQTQGEEVESDAISSMFDATSTKEMQEFSKSLQEIADSNLTDKEKNAEILKQLDGIDGTIGDGVNKIDGATNAYNRLHLAMETVGVTAQDIADYFVLETGAYDSKTIEGITKQYNAAKIALENLKSGAINIDDLVKYDATKNEATGRVDTIAEQLKGVSLEVREQFSSIVESIKEGSYKTEDGLTDWDAAIRKLELQGIQTVITNVKTELESANKIAFPDLEISGWIDSVDELSGAFESLASAMDLIVTAQEQMNSSGRISMKTALELMATTDDWNQILDVNNGIITMNSNAEQILIQSKLNLIKANVEMALQQVETDIATMEGAINSAEAGNILVEGLGGAIKHVQSALVGLKAGWDALWSGEDVFDAISNGYNRTFNKLTPSQTSLEALYQQKAELEEKLNMIGGVDTTQEFKDNYDFDKNPGDKYGESEDDAFQREMDYWENRIAANQAKYEQLQNEIDLLEAKGQKADAAYYEEQIKLEGQRLELLNGQKQAALDRLAVVEVAEGKGSENWWEIASTLNDIEGEIDDVTASIVDLQDSIGEIDTYKFEEFNTRLDNLVSKLGTIRDLIAPDGEEDWFDDEGNWTDSGIAVAGTYLQELETYKQGYQETIDELAKYKPDYESNKSYYEGLGIHSEQEYYDKTEELISQQYDFAESISDTEQSIVDMYESSIDATEEYIETLIDGYNDYIDSVKEALEVERSLYEFKKNVQKQAKDIAEIERRIASLSGSTNKADIAERRKLEAQLYESRESLNDTYYDHAKDAQNEALDAEQEAYETAMTKMVDKMRVSLEEATTDMASFLDSVTIAVSMNADTVLQKYQDTEVPLNDAITNPWEDAKAAVGNYGGDANNLMDVWKADGYFAEFKSTASTNLSSPWNSGVTAANTFKNSVSTVMNGVVSNISTNVKTASSELSKLYQQIIDTKNKATSVNYYESDDDDFDHHYFESDYEDSYTEPKKSMHHVMSTVKDIILGSQSFVDANTETIDGIKYYKSSEGRYFKISDLKKKKYDGGRTTGWAIPAYTAGYSYYAKGTLGTKRDEWAITNELGPELTMYATPEGTLSFMRAGSTVVPADLTREIIDIAELGIDGLTNMPKFNSGVTMISNAINKPEINLSFEALVKAERIDENTLPEVKKFVQQEINTLVKQMNYAIKGKGGR